LDSHDLDIAIDKMMGEKFAERLIEYLRTKNISASSCGVIQSNPDRSKHLETATLAIFGQFIDFVNLRAETYANDSRIPNSISFGTPLEDALRRDITINSMFWNVHTEEVEDFTGFGLLDLDEGTIRTPLPSKETLLDDPLRLLRVIRFSTRFQYKIVPELIEAMQDPVVHEHLMQKVSRERIGIEIDKILHDRYGLQGMFLVNQAGVFNSVFGCQDLSKLSGVEFEGKPTSIEGIDALLNAFAKIIYFNSEWSKSQLRLGLLACALLPSAGQKYRVKSPSQQNPQHSGVKEDFVVHVIIRDCLKLSNKDICAVGAVLNHLDRVDSLLMDHTRDHDPVLIGRLLKDIGSEWKLSFALATVRSFWLNGCNPMEELVVREYLSKLSNLLLYIDGIGLSEAWNFKPLLSGKEVQDHLRIKPSSVVGKHLSELLDWQFANPHGTKAEAIEVLLRK
jgi:tRNA nucleotidyltransferase (CCA-adding enzyme)